MQSRNNLKQIVLAFHNFEDAFKRLPSGCDEEEKPGLAKLGIDVETMISNYSEAHVLDYDSVLDSIAAERISHCKNLEALKVGSIVENDQVIEFLKSMQRLKYLVGNFEADLLNQLRIALPACEVSSTIRTGWHAQRL